MTGYFFPSLSITDLRSVVAEPVVSLSEVVENDAAAVASTSRQDDWGGGVGFAGHPGGMESVRDEEEGHDQNHPTGNLVDKQHRMSHFWTLTLRREIIQEKCH